MIRILAIVIFACAVFNAAQYPYLNYKSVIVEALLILAAAGMWYRKRWSQFIVYALTLAYVPLWLWALYDSMHHSGESGSLGSALSSNIADTLMVFVFVWASVILFRSFRVRS